MVEPKYPRGLAADYPTLQRLGRFRITQPLADDEAMRKMLGLSDDFAEGDKIFPGRWGATPGSMLTVEKRSDSISR
jgi:hypothetical protein